MSDSLALRRRSGEVNAQKHSALDACHNVVARLERVKLLFRNATQDVNSAVSAPANDLNTVAEDLEDLQVHWDSIIINQLWHTIYPHSGEQQPSTIPSKLYKALAAAASNCNRTLDEVQTLVDAPEAKKTHFLGLPIRQEPAGGTDVLQKSRTYLADQKRRIQLLAEIMAVWDVLCTQGPSERRDVVELLSKLSTVNTTILSIQMEISPPDETAHLAQISMECTQEVLKDLLARCEGRQALDLGGPLEPDEQPPADLAVDVDQRRHLAEHLRFEPSGSEAALEAALVEGRITKFLRLLDGRREPNSGSCLVHLAACFADANVLETLIANGYSVNHGCNRFRLYRPTPCPMNYFTPLHLAVGARWKEIIGILRSHNANVEVQSYRSYARFVSKVQLDLDDLDTSLVRSPAAECLSQRWLEVLPPSSAEDITDILQALHDYGWDLDGATSSNEFRNGPTLLMQAICADYHLGNFQIDIINKLCKMGANSLVPTVGFGCPIKAAIMSGQNEVMGSPVKHKKQDYINLTIQVKRNGPKPAELDIMKYAVYLHSNCASATVREHYRNALSKFAEDVGRDWLAQLSRHSTNAGPLIPLSWFESSERAKIKCRWHNATREIRLNALELAEILNDKEMVTLLEDT